MKLNKKVLKYDEIKNVIKQVKKKNYKNYFENACKDFTLKRINQKLYKSGNILCKTCLGVWNRDVNDATNIYRIAKNAINGLERPKYLCREKKDGYIKVKKSKK